MKECAYTSEGAYFGREALYFGFILNSIKILKYKIINKQSEEVIVVQIAGVIARRIVCEVSKDQELEQGSRIGMIRFGSRVDMYFEKYNPLVKINQKTISGETLIAKK